jgi:hypothetical protein
VNRSPRGPRRAKVRIGISPDPTLLEWVDQNTGPGKRFATRTHAFEAGIASLVERFSSAKGDGGASAAAGRKPQPSRP